MSFEMRWDLSFLVSSVKPDKIKDMLESMVIAANVIREIYSGQVKGMDASGVKKLLASMDSFTLEFDGVMSYCSLRYAADSTDDVAKQLHDAMRNASVKVGQALAFIEIELAELLKSNPSILSDAKLAEFRHFLERIELRAPHLLPEAQEQLVMAKDRNGIGAWSQLQSDWLGTRTFRIKVGGEEKELPYGEIISFFHSPDRELRREAFRAVLGTLGKDEIVFASALRAVCADHLSMCQWRKYDSPMRQSLLSNDVEEEAISAMMRVVGRSTGLYHRYLRTKAKLLNVDRIGNWDLTAPLPQASSLHFDWDRSRTLVTKAYANFDSEFGSWVDEMYSLRRIDGEVRNGKTPGAFCHSWLSGKSAFILQSYNGRIMDVYTQAHELGHAIHTYLYSRAQTPVNCDIGSCIAECGSTFGELLLTEQLLAEARSKEERQVAISTVLDELGIAVFIVGARFWFEEDLYEAIGKGRFLDGETLGRMWGAARARMFAEEVEWLPEMRYDWTRPPHYYIPNYRFYNYPYIFAQLFVFALYRLYKEQGKAFVPKLRGLLSAGCSSSPAELARDLGFDISTEEFWEKGMRQVEEFLRLLEETM